MNTSSWTRSTLRVMAATLGAAAGAYGVYAALTRFRRYWAFALPGIALIRSFSLGPLKAEAERRAHAAVSGACERAW